MKIYRGPSSQDFHHPSHELVDEIPPKGMAALVKPGDPYVFNINKESNDRQSVCSMLIEHADLAPMATSLINTLGERHAALLNIKDIAYNHSLSDSEKLQRIYRELSCLLV